MQSAYQLIDAFWVGRLGGAAVAAVSLSFPVMFLMIALGMGLAMAGSTLTAQYRGAGNDSDGGPCRGPDPQHGGGAFHRPQRAGLFRHAQRCCISWAWRPDVYAGALGFMRVSFVALLFNFTFFVFQSIMRGVGRPTLPVYIVLVTVILNFALDPLFIFGWGPVPGYGVMGAALATLATQVLAAIDRHDRAAAWARHGIHVKRARFHSRYRLYEARLLSGRAGLGGAIGPRPGPDGDDLPDRLLRHPAPWRPMASAPIFCRW